MWFKEISQMFFDFLKALMAGDNPIVFCVLVIAIYGVYIMPEKTETIATAAISGLLGLARNTLKGGT